jgi:hypothetical protein
MATGLTLREEKGSKLTIEEMDGNLTYLQSIAGGGISVKFINGDDLSDTWTADEMTFKVYNSLITDDIIHITKGSGVTVIVELPTPTTNKKISYEYNQETFFVKTPLTLLSSNTDVHPVDGEYLTGEESNAGGRIDAYFDASNSTWYVAVTSHN